MTLKRLVRQEQVGLVVGYTAAFIVDKFIKVSAVQYGYKTISWIASKIKSHHQQGKFFSNVQLMVSGMLIKY
jgi:hypothetical protein